MTRTMTRRQLLKLITAATATAALSPVLHTRAYYPTRHTHPDDPWLNNWVLRGRAIHTVAFYEKPDASSKRLNTLTRDNSCRILRAVRAPFSRHNDLWYHTDLGYAHSAWLLPMRIYPPQPFIEEIGEWGFWGEISQVFTEARTQPSPIAARKYRFYGGTMFHVIGTARIVRATAGTKSQTTIRPKLSAIINGCWQRTFDASPARRCRLSTPSWATSTSRWIWRRSR